MSFIVESIWDVKLTAEKYDLASFYTIDAGLLTSSGAEGVQTADVVTGITSLYEKINDMLWMKLVSDR